MTDCNLPPGYRLIALGHVGSTNDEARTLIAAGDAKGAVVQADSQKAGRGRYGRDWASPPGNLYCSIVLEPAVARNRLGEIAFVAALAARDAVSVNMPAEVSLALKWPNDVMAAACKIAGILVETETPADAAVSSVIVGVGVNIVSAPAETSYPATAMAAFGPAPETAKVLASLVAALDRRIDSWICEGFTPVRREWMQHAYGVGGQVGASNGVTGAFAGLDDTGALIIAQKDGERHHLVSGSVRYL